MRQQTKKTNIDALIEQINELIAFTQKLPVCDQNICSELSRAVNDLCAMIDALTPELTVTVNQNLQDVGLSDIILNTKFKTAEDLLSGEKIFPAVRLIQSIVQSLLAALIDVLPPKIKLIVDSIREVYDLIWGKHILSTSTDSEEKKKQKSDNWEPFLDDEEPVG